MPDHIRFFSCDADIRRTGEAMLACTLPRTEWTHEAHLSTCLWIILERMEIVPECHLGERIRAYNVSMGGVNSDTEGYHETITQTFVRGARVYLARQLPGADLLDLVNGFLAAPEGKRDYPLQLYSRETLFSVIARRTFVEQDLGQIMG